MPSAKLAFACPLLLLIPDLFRPIVNLFLRVEFDTIAKIEKDSN